MSLRFFNIGILLILVVLKSNVESRNAFEVRRGTNIVNASIESTNNINKIKLANCNISIASSVHDEKNKDIEKQRRCLLSGQPDSHESKKRHSPPSKRPTRPKKPRNKLQGCPSKKCQQSSESDYSDASNSNDESSESEEQYTSESEEQNTSESKKQNPSDININNKAKNENNINFASSEKSIKRKKPKGKQLKRKTIRYRGFKYDDILAVIN